jgi:alkyl sulfatase BDS1-like metallo-beta-lactamase superfamily hydrolase
MEYKKAVIAVITLGILMTGCDDAPVIEQGANEQGHTAATAITVQANRAVLEQLPFEDKQDFIDARRGLIAQEDELHIKHLQGNTIWNMSDYDFVDVDGDNAPATVNPSLWRQAALNNIHGLFEVTEGIYQIRGYDLANMTIIAGDSGWIIVDPLTARENASRAWQFARQHLEQRPVKAILFTHSHLDHFGGVAGIKEHLSEQELAELLIYAPGGFVDEATSENIIAGSAMSRRAMYMYGKNLARNERGHVGTGLGKAPSFGSFGFAKPTVVITEENLQQEIDGVPFEFQIVSGSEAPSEFTFYLPEQNAFCGAELVSRNLHNLYTLRGTKVRDALLWSGFIEEARERFGKAEIYFASHHWPMWGTEQINDFLIKQSDTYKFIHDQSVRMLNEGFTPNEIADNLALPDELMTQFHNQGYYGTVSHNAKAVYQMYLGWFTANPAKLNPLPEEQVARRYIQMMGGIEQVLSVASNEFEAASKLSVEEGVQTYRWLAELMNHAVFAEPGNAEARGLLAKIYDQLGYLAESAPWRDFYLTGAYELRHGAPEQGISPAFMKDILIEAPVTNFFASMAVRLNAEKAEGEQLAIKIIFTDLDESYLLTLNNSVLRHKQVEKSAPADATLELTHELFVDIALGIAGMKETLLSDELNIEGSTLDLVNFFSMLEKPQGRFNIITP